MQTALREAWPWMSSLLQPRQSPKVWKHCPLSSASSLGNKSILPSWKLSGNLPQCTRNLMCIFLSFRDTPIGWCYYPNCTDEVIMAYRDFITFSGKTAWFIFIKNFRVWICVPIHPDDLSVFITCVSFVLKSVQLRWSLNRHKRSTYIEPALKVPEANALEAWWQGSVRGQARRGLKESERRNQ